MEQLLQDLKQQNFKKIFLKIFNLSIDKSVFIRYNQIKIKKNIQH